MRQYTVGQMCIVKKSEHTANNYKTIAIHEMGHLFGWKGHSTNSSDVMYEAISSAITLTNRDKNHLKQIYDLYYS